MTNRLSRKTQEERLTLLFWTINLLIGISLLAFGLR